MGELYERIISLCEDRGIKGFRMCKEIGIQPSILTDMKMGRTKGMSAKNLQKVANYFGITVDELLGNEKTPSIDGERELSLADIKYAFFGGDADLATEEDLADVRRVAAMLIERRKRNGN